METHRKNKKMGILQKEIVIHLNLLIILIFCVTLLF